MPKLSIRSDGTCYTRAAVLIDGSRQPRTFEIDYKGKKWLAEQGISRDEQEIPRAYFNYLWDLGWIYTNGKGPRTPKVIIRKLDPDARSVSNRVASVAPQQTPPTAAVTMPTRSQSPSHWQRRTAKKDWFK